MPGQHTARYALGRGYRCAIIERRGQWQALKAARFNIFGDADDLEAAVKKLRSLFPSAPLFLAGISAGSALVVSGLGKFDARRRAGDASAPSFLAAGDLYPGFDIAPGGCMMRVKPPFGSILLSSMKGFFLQPNEEVLRGYDSGAFDAAMAAKTCDEFMDAIATFAGYPSGREVFDVYENPVRFVESVDTPLLILLSEDDPISIKENFTSVERGSLHTKMKKQHAWKPQLRISHAKLMPFMKDACIISDRPP